MTWGLLLPKGRLPFAVVGWSSVTGESIELMVVESKAAAGAYSP